jgi:uncharacterized protein YdcH (DUF465 family)
VRKQGQEPREHRTLQSIQGNDMTTREKLINHVEHLKEKHATLDKQIDLMEASGNYVDDDLNHLKKKRLSIKDEMEQANRKINNIQ